MPRTLVDGLADPDLTSTCYASLLENPRIRAPLADWNEREDFDGLRRATERLTQRLDEVVHFKDTSRLSTKVIPSIRLIANALTPKSTSSFTKRIGVVAPGFAFFGSRAGWWDVSSEDGIAVGTAAGAAVGVTSAAVGLGLDKFGSALKNHAQDRKIQRIVQSIIDIEKKARVLEQE
jgi:hypothetical protein